MLNMLAALAALALIATPPEARAVEVTDKSSFMEQSPSGDRVVVITDAAKVKVVGGDGTAVDSFDAAAPVTSVAFAPDGRRLALCLENKGVLVKREGQAQPTVLEAKGQCTSLQWSKDGRTLLYMLKTVDPYSLNPDTTVEAKSWDDESRKLKTLTTTTVSAPRRPDPAPEKPRKPVVIAPDKAKDLGPAELFILQRDPDHAPDNIKRKAGLMP